MAYSTGRASFVGTGSKTVNTNLAGTPTWCRLTLVDLASSNISVGTCDGTHQNYQSTNAGSSSSKILTLKNGAGTVIADATWTSFGMSGGLGTVTINVTTDAGTSFTLEVGN